MKEGELPQFWAVSLWQTLAYCTIPALKWAVSGCCCFWGSSQQLFVIALLLKETKVNSLKAVCQIVLLQGLFLLLLDCWLVQCDQYQDLSHLCPWWQFPFVSLGAECETVTSLWAWNLCGQCFACWRLFFKHSLPQYLFHHSSHCCPKKKKKKILHDSSYFLPQAQTMWAKCSRALTAQLWLSARRVSLTTAPRLPKLPLLQNSYKAQFFKVQKKSLKVIFRRWVYQ